MKITKKIAERLELRDDATEHGGKSYSDEKLDNFMAECEIPFGSSLKRVNKALVECGLEPFTEEEVKETAIVIKSEKWTEKLTSEELSDIAVKAREKINNAESSVYFAIKRVLREHGGKIDTIYSREQIIHDEYDADELIVLESMDDHDDFYWLYGLQLDKEGRIEFLAVDPIKRVGVVLQNIMLNYDIISIADALECELENIEYEEHNNLFKR